MTQKQSVVIDGNAIGYASQHSSPLTNAGKPVQAIYGFLRTVMALKRRFNTADFYVLWDEKAQWRYDIWPEYKGKRDKDEKQRLNREQYREQRPIIMELSQLLGLAQLSAPDFEADDLAGWMVRNANPERTEITLVSGDMDWVQLVRKGVRWFDPRKDGKWIEFDTFHQQTGHRNTTEFLLAKMIEGDSSDNIPGINGVGVKAIAEIQDKYGSLSTVLKMPVDHTFDKTFVPEGFNTRFVSSLNKLCSKDGREILYRNHKLMGLMGYRRDEEIKSAIKITCQRTDFGAFLARCLDLEFSSITSRPDPWKKVFVGE